MLRAVREAVWRRAEGKCERCHRPIERSNWEGHVHHVVYRGHGKERPEDLELRCLDCHGAQHPQHTFRTKTEQAAVREARRPYRKRKKGRGNKGLTGGEARALTRGAGSWAWRPEP